MPDELQVHLDETNERGEWGLELVSSYALSGPRAPSEGLRPSFHLLQLTPEFTYGLTDRTQIGFQVFSSFGTHGEARVDGGRLILHTLFARAEEEGPGLFLGGLLEVGRLPRTLSENPLDLELKGILGYRAGRWLFAANPEVGTRLARNGLSRAELSSRFKAAYAIGSGRSVGLEHYGGLGTPRRPGTSRESQQTFAVVDFKAGKADMNFGLGRGWNEFSERWVIKAVLAMPLGH